jgi:hypothetical protein
MPGNVGENIRNWVDDNLHRQTDDELPGQLDDGERFIQSAVLPAFEEVRQTLARDGNQVSITNGQSNATLRVMRGDEEIFTYHARTRITDRGSFPIFESRGINGRQSPAGDGHLRPDTPENQRYDATHITKAEVVQHIFTAYRTETEDAR